MSRFIDGVDKLMDAGTAASALVALLTPAVIMPPFLGFQINDQWSALV